MDKHWIVALSFLFAAAATTAQADSGTSVHKIDIVEKPITINGTTTEARLFDGQLPGPMIRAKEGQTLNATFCNKMGEPTSVHWHGARLPNNQDGVPGITTPEIQPGKCLTYSFPVIQSGTYWYHAHSNGQEQQGLYGSLVFDPKDDDALEADHEIPVVLSDFTHESPEQVLRNLKRSDDYYALCKGTVQSWDKVIENGAGAVQNRLKANLERMGPMDKTDVCYSGPGDAFLINGKPATRIDNPNKPVKQHQSVRLRLINAAASSTFDVRSGCGGSMTIMAKDGMPVESKDVSSLQMAPAETYDIKIYKHEENSCGIRATSIDGTGAVLGIIGDGDYPVLPPSMEKPNPYAQSHDHHSGGEEKPHAGHDMMDHSKMNHAGMDHGSMAADSGPLDLLYTGLRAKDPADFDSKKPWRNITLHLTGQMNGYVWSFDNKTFSEARPIDIRQNDNVRMTFVNDSMMDHPIHIHGFFARVRNDGGNLGPQMNVIMVPVGKTVIVEFNADTPGDWMMHCHIAYHMEAGMARILHVAPEKAPERNEIIVLHEDPFPLDEGGQHNSARTSAHKPGAHGMDKKPLLSGNAALYTGSASIDFTYGNHQDRIQFESKAGFARQRAEITYERRLTPHFGIFAGAEFEREQQRGRHGFDNSVNGLFGFRYTLPLMIEMEAAVRTDGGGKVKLGTGDIHLTERVYLNLAVKAEKKPGEGIKIFEMPEIGYRINQDFSCGIRRDMEAGMQIGVGCRFGF